MSHRICLFLKFLRRKLFKYFRKLIGIFFSFYLRKIHNPQYFPLKGPCLIISNHLSYLDSLIVSSILRNQYIVILASEEIKKNPVMLYLSHFNRVIFADHTKMSLSALKEILRLLKEGYIVLLYPEGTRSRNGCLNEPRLGFVKIAHSANVPIVPIAMEGTFEILPSHKKIPKFRRCDLYVGKPIHIDKENKEFSKYFDSEGSLIKEKADIIAFQIMNQIRKMINQPWDKSVVSKLKDLGVDIEENCSNI